MDTELGNYDFLLGKTNEACTQARPSRLLAVDRY